MKIAQITATFPPYMSGTGNVCYHNSIELAKMGHDVTVITSFCEGKFEYDSSIDIIRYKSLFKIGNAPFMPQLVSLKNYDIIHLHYPFILGSEFILLNSMLKGNNLLITHHQDLIINNIPENLIKAYNTLIRNPLLSRSRRIFVPTLDYVSSSSLRSLEQNIQNKMVELPNGVDIQSFNPYIFSDDLKSKHNLSNNKVVLFVGSLDRAHYFKGVDILLRAFSNIKTNSVLIIVGDGNLRKDYEHLAKKLSISQRVIFPGNVSNEDLKKYYSLASLLVLPSNSLGEIFGLVLIEAMACGKPVIASRLPGVRTVVDNGINGFLFSPGDVKELADKIDYILTNESEAKKMGSAGRTKVENYYSWIKIGSRLESIYKEVLAD